MEPAADLPVGKKAFLHLQTDELYVWQCIQFDCLDALKEVLQKRKVDLKFTALNADGCVVGNALYVSLFNYSLETMQFILNAYPWSLMDLIYAYQTLRKNELFKKASPSRPERVKLILDKLDAYPEFLDEFCLMYNENGIVELIEDAKIHKKWNIMESLLDKKISHTCALHIANAAIHAQKWDLAQKAVDNPNFDRHHNDRLFYSNKGIVNGQTSSMLTWDVDHLIRFAQFLVDNKLVSSKFPFYHIAAKKGSHDLANALMKYRFDIDAYYYNICHSLCHSGDEELLHIMRPRLGKDHMENLAIFVKDNPKRFNMIWLLMNAPLSVCEREFFGVKHEKLCSYDGRFHFVENNPLAPLIAYAYITLVEEGHYTLIHRRKYYAMGMRPQEYDFMNIVLKLPLELRMLVCNAAYKQPHNKIFVSKHVMAAINYVFKQAESDDRISRIPMALEMGLITHDEASKFFVPTPELFM